MAILKKKIVFSPPISAEAHLQELELNTRILEDTKKALMQTLDAFEIERAQLEKAKLKDEAILSSIGEGLVVTDHDMKVIRINAVGEKMLGWREEELLGKEWFQCVKVLDEQGKEIPILQTPFGIALTTTTTTTTSQFVRKDGSTFPAVITVSQIKMGSDLFGAVLVFRDITKEKEIEKLRIDFLSLASHQLRTPLSGTKWLIGTLQRKIIGPLTQKQKEYLDQIYQVNERMIKLVFDMLSALRLESGGTDGKKEEINAYALYQDIKNIMSPAAKPKNVSVVIAPTMGKTLALVADKQMLQNIVESFVSNAINYSPSDQEIIMDAKEEATAIVFSVRDFGIGIPKEEQKRIFERFYRASNAKALKPDGTGLGLYIASMLAEKIGAKILFESPAFVEKTSAGKEVGKGSTFYLRIPK